MSRSKRLFKFHLLGPVRASRGDADVRLGSPRQKAIFVALAMRANSVVSRHQLIDDVWGEDVPGSALGSVYTYVSALRGALDPAGALDRKDQPLMTAGGGYSLHVAPGALDVNRFVELRERAQERQIAGDLDEELQLLEAALALWHGEALSGVPGPYAISQRTRLADLRIATIEQRTEVLLALGRFQDQAADLIDLIEENPLRENLRRLQMLALYKSGRPADALQVFRTTRQLLVAELGVEPGPRLQRLHEMIIANDPRLESDPQRATAATISSQPPLRVVPLGVSNAWMNGPTTLIGRTNEIRVLERVVVDLMHGRGNLVWIEGDAGIGKSQLLTVGLAAANTMHCQIAWAVADELSRRFPLHVVLESLGGDSSTSSQRLAATPPAEQEQIAAGHFRHVVGSADPVLTAMDRVLTLVKELCAKAPLMMVIDDLQWADEVSQALWHRLSGLTQQLPLLLISASRRTSNAASLSQLRLALQRRGSSILSLTALSRADANELLVHVIGAVPGPSLQGLADRAAGNPLYLREMVDAVLVAGGLTVRNGTAEFDEAATYQAPTSLMTALSRRLANLSTSAREVLQVAAILGSEFTVDDVALVLRKSASDLLAPINEAVATSVLVEGGVRLAFRHPLLHQALLDTMATSMRAALQRQAAATFADAGGPVDRVARLLVASRITVDNWLIQWLANNNAELIDRAIAIAEELLRSVLRNVPRSHPERERLTASMARVLYRMSNNPEQEARDVLGSSSDPQVIAEMRYILANSFYRSGQPERAIDVLREATQDRSVPNVWRARQQSLLARYLCSGVDDLEAAKSSALDAIELADTAHDSFAGAYAHETLFHVSAVRRDHEQALAHVDLAIDLVSNSSSEVDMHLNLLDTRLFCLQNLDRLAEGFETLRVAADLAGAHDLPLALPISAAIHYYWTGQWDHAWKQLGSVVEGDPTLTFSGVRESTPAMLLMHGVAALIAIHQGDSGLVAEHLDAAAKYTLRTSGDRDNCDFLIVAQALAAEQRGFVLDALTLLEPLLDLSFAPMMLRHQWLPLLVRMALSIGVREKAQEALRVCEVEAAKEVTPARAHAAAQWCRGLVFGDRGLLLTAAENYRQVDRPVEMAQCLEDAAAVLVGQPDAAAKDLVTRARHIYSQLGARSDIERCDRRLVVCL